MDRKPIYDFTTGAFSFNDEMSPARNAAYLALAEANAYLKISWIPANAAELATARTSDTIFTPTVSEAWDTDELEGTYAVLYADGAETVFTIHEIASNTATAATISTSTLDPVILAAADMYLLFATLAAAQAAMTVVKV